MWTPIGRLLDAYYLPNIYAFTPSNCRMGGIGGTHSKRAYHLGNGDGIPFENATQVTEFDVDGSFVTVPGSALFDDDTQFDTGSEFQPFVHLQPLDTEWVETTSTTVAVFTTPTASVQGESLNPLAHVSEETFVTEDGGEYLEASGILEESGLGTDLSWVIPPAAVGSRSSTLFDQTTPLWSYLGLVEDGAGDVRTLLVHVSKVSLDDEVAFGVGVQHRTFWADGSDDAVRSIVDELGSRSVDDMVGDDDEALVTQTGIDASASHVASVLDAVERS